MENAQQNVELTNENIRRPKLKSYAKIFAGLTIMLILCTTILVAIVYSTPSFTLDMIANKLENKPEEYFVVRDADPVLSKAISRLGEPIRFNSMNETQIDDLMSQYGTGNVEYQNSYYDVDIVTGDNFQYVGLMWFSLIGLAISVILFVSFAILKQLSQKENAHGIN